MWTSRAGCCLLLLLLVATSCGQAAETENTEQGAAPFDAVLIELFGTEDTDAYLRSVERRSSELLMTCMEEAGFEFQIPPARTTLPLPAPDSVEDAQSQGFGIIAGFRHQIEETDPSTQFGPDPNNEYLSTLTRDEIQRFFLTLEGVEAEPGQRQQESGCNGQASDQAYADWLRFFQAMPNYTAMGEERDTHPDWLAARDDWRTCMIDRGFDYAEPDAIRSDVTARMRQTVAELYPQSQVPIVEVEGRLQVDPVVDELLDDLLQFEQNAAVANVECTLPVAGRFDAVEREVQQGFVDRNRTVIDELLGGS